MKIVMRIKTRREVLLDVWLATRIHFELESFINYMIYDLYHGFTLNMSELDIDHFKEACTDQNMEYLLNQDAKDAVADIKNHADYAEAKYLCFV